MATKNEKAILIYADWVELAGIQPMGKLFTQRLRGKEIFYFEYEQSWLSSNHALFLDPNLGFFQGKQFLPEDKQNFGIFLDSSPDRWGRLLMRRREAAQARREGRKEENLYETDYLLGVYDKHRLGGLRFKLEEKGDFMNNQKEFATPPWTTLRELEFASLQLEREDSVNNPDYLKWLALLVDPGSSLGGARPKASVLDEKGSLWIAKFPSINDTKDSGAWEMVLQQLAIKCGIDVPQAQLAKFTGKHHTYLSKRFDRTEKMNRIHFESAMTLLGYQDGADYQEGISYLEIVSFILQYSSESIYDLEQLWRRVVFNIMVSNTDDHLRNHGFLLTKQGWRLSPAFDLNPNEQGTGLKLNISENDNSLEIDLAMSVAKYFKLKETKANLIIKEMAKVILDWKNIAKMNRISPGEIELVKNAFRASIV